MPRDLLLAVVCALLAPVGAQATSYVLVADDHLTDQAPLVVRGRVTAADDAPPGAPPARLYRVAVDRAAKGTPPGDLVVRVPGNAQPPGGMGLRVFGAPTFRTDEQLLLFLAPNADGTYHVLHLFMGAFTALPTGPRVLATRDAAGAHAPGTAAAPAPDGPRDLDRFADWVADRAAGAQRPPDYFVDDAPHLEAFRLFEVDGVPVRWFQFDGPGEAIPWRSYAGGQPGVPGRGHRQVRAALRAWTRDRGTNIRYAYAGRTDATGGLDEFDGINTVLFGTSLGEPFDCVLGGVLAVGGPWLDVTRRRSHGGTRYIPISGGDVVVNKGLGCFFRQTPDARKAAQELFAHELGHTLGLGHSCGDDESGPCDTPAANEALMRAFVHADGRGGRLTADDRAGICALYHPADLDEASCAAVPARRQGAKNAAIRPGR